MIPSAEGILKEVSNQPEYGPRQSSSLGDSKGHTQVSTLFPNLKMRPVHHLYKGKENYIAQTIQQNLSVISPKTEKAKCIYINTTVYKVYNQIQERYKCIQSFS